MSKRTFNLTITTLLGIYLLILEINNKLGFYLNDRYFTLSKITTISILSVSLIGLMYSIYKDSKHKKFKSRISNLHSLFKDLKFYLFLIFILQIISVIILKINDTKLNIFDNLENSLQTFTSPILLILVGGALLLPWKESKFDQWLSKLNFMNIFMIVVLLGAILIPPQTLTQIIFSQRQNNLNSFVGINNSTESVFDQFSGNTENYEIGDWINAINFESDITKFVDKKANVTGFITIPDGISENQFLVSRFAISCCVLDATPVGLLAESEKLSEFKTDEWVRVEGVLEIKQVKGRDQLVIKVEKIEMTEVPDKPYIS
jgi:uncharacterized repeat protein (TIGR03943 family)